MQLLKARVCRSAKREFECKLLDSEKTVMAKAMGNLLKKNETIVVGDYVEIEKDQSLDIYHIVKVAPRSSEIFRVIIREAKKKVTAANCDLLIILTSVSKPEYKRGIIDRFLVRAYQWGVEPIVVFNKMDEYNEDSFDIKFERDRLKSLSIKSFEISAKDSNYKNSYLELGPESLKNYLKNKTAIFLGQSGVGKSSTISWLSGGEIDLRVKAVGKGGKGAHTTTWSEIIDFDDFSLIDSPGIRSFSIDDLVGENLIDYFPDLSDIAVNCKFSDCNHIENSKGCAFRENKTNLDDYEYKLLISRLDSFLRMNDEIAEIPVWQKKV